MKQRIIFAGTPEFAAQSLQAILNNLTTLNAEVVAVYTQPDRKAGRGQKVTASAVKQLAQTYQLPIEQPLTFKKSTPEGIQARETLKTYQADVMVVAAYGLILPLGVLNTPKLGCINIHASLLPRWRGAAPIHRALLANDKETGITIMQMDKGLDTGDMLYKTHCIISPTDTSATLHDKLAQQGGEAIVTVLEDLPSFQKTAEKQDNTQANYAEKLTKAEGKIDWQQTAIQVDAHIRGLQPWPVAYTQQKPHVEIKNAPFTVRVHEAKVIDNESWGTIGEVLEINKSGVLVQCGTGKILLTQLQWPGGKTLSAEQFSNSNKISVNDIFL